MWEDKCQKTQTQSHVSVVWQSLPPVCIMWDKGPLTGQHSHWPLLWLLSSSRKWFCQCVKTGEHLLGPQHREKGCLYTVRNGGASQVLCTPATYSCIYEPVKWVIPYSQLFSINQTESGWCSPADTTIVLFDFLRVEMKTSTRRNKTYHYTSVSLFFCVPLSLNSLIEVLFLGYFYSIQILYFLQISHVHVANKWNNKCSPAANSSSFIQFWFLSGLLTAYCGWKCRGVKTTSNQWNVQTQTEAGHTAGSLLRLPGRQLLCLGK